MVPMLRPGFSFAPFSNFRTNRLDELFDRVFGEEPAAGASWAWSSAAVSLWHDDDKVYVEAELPGVSEKDVEVTVHNGVLTIKAERQPVEGRQYVYNTRTFGRFERSIVLPELVDSSAVEATLTNGVLQLVLPKHPESRPRKITLRTA